jgi:hypothetical protein
MAFSGCTNLTSVTIPGSLTDCGMGVFGNCTSLSEVNIANGVTSLVPDEFYGCTSLGNCTLPASVTNIGSAAFEGCKGLTNITIPGSVTAISSGAFQDCTNLACVTIPGSVTNLGAEAFFLCTRLSSVYFMGDAPSFGLAAFGYDGYATLYYRPGTTGWRSMADSPPAVLWNPSIPASEGSMGMQNNQFGFNIIGTSNIAVVVEACTNLSSSVWTPIKTVTLTNGSCYFSEPLGTNPTGRFYRLSMP